MTSPSPMNLSDAFAGLRVCDLSQGVAGPHGAMLLAQFGADVVKVEPPDGDWGRNLGERLAREGGTGDHGAHSFVFNQGKRSLAVDLKNPHGRQALRELAATCHVFIESFRPGVAARLGFGYEAVRALRPDVVYASLSGFGQRGPYSERGTVDALMQGFSGMMVMNQSADGTPQRQNMTAVDVLAGLYLFGAIAAAVAKRDRTGEGGYLDINLMQASGAFQMAKIMEFQYMGGTAPAMYAPAGYLRTADGAVSISTMRQEHYEKLCGAIDRADLVTDPRYAEKNTRIANSRALMAEIEGVTRTWPTAELLARLHAAGVFVERVQSYGEWMRDEHVRQTDSYGWAETPAGTMPVATIPGLGAPEPGDARTRAPRIGEHSAQVLGEIGMDAAQVAALSASGAIR